MHSDGRRVHDGINVMILTGELTTIQGDGQEVQESVQEVRENGQEVRGSGQEVQEDVHQWEGVHQLVKTDTRLEDGRDLAAKTDDHENIHQQDVQDPAAETEDREAILQSDVILRIVTALLLLDDQEVSSKLNAGKKHEDLHRKILIYQEMNEKRRNRVTNERRNLQRKARSVTAALAAAVAPVPTLLATTRKNQDVKQFVFNFFFILKMFN